MKFALEDSVKRLGAVAIKLDRLALFAWNLPRVSAIRVDLHDNAAIAFKASIRRFDFIM